MKTHKHKRGRTNPNTMNRTTMAVTGTNNTGNTTTTTMESTSSKTTFAAIAAAAATAAATSAAAASAAATAAATAAAGENHAASRIIVATTSHGLSLSKTSLALVQPHLLRPLFNSEIRKPFHKTRTKMVDQERWELIWRVLEHDGMVASKSYSLLVKMNMRKILNEEWKKLYGQSINHKLVDQYYVEHQKLYRKENNKKREVVFDTMVFDIIHRYHARTGHRGLTIRQTYTQISQQYYNIAETMVKEYVNLVNRIIYKKDTAHLQAISTTAPVPATVATPPVDDDTAARKINNNNNNNNNNNTALDAGAGRTTSVSTSSLTSFASSMLTSPISSVLTESSILPPNNINQEPSPESSVSPVTGKIVRSPVPSPNLVVAAAAVLVANRGSESALHRAESLTASIPAIDGTREDDEDDNVNNDWVEGKGWIRESKDDDFVYL